MRKVKTFLTIIMMSLVMISCTNSSQQKAEQADAPRDQYDQLYVMDAEGNVYQLIHSAIDAYFVKEIDVDAIDDIRKSK